MGDWHLQEIRRALEAKGWQVLAEAPGDDYRLSGSWEIQRSTRRPPLHLDFEGQQEERCLPMPQSYGCHLRERRDVGLYFRRQRRLAHWQRELQAFLAALDAVETASLDPRRNPDEVLPSESS